jgi:glycerol uptake facilitator-like aquaporin
MRNVRFLCDSTGVGLATEQQMSPTNVVTRVLLALLLAVAVAIVCLWWYYRPTIEAGSAGLSSRTESISIPSISIGITNPFLLTFLVAVVLLFVILKFVR